VVRGEIRLADRVYLQPDRMANVLADGADVVIRVAWKNARWQQETGEPFDLIDTLRQAKADRIDVPVWIGRRRGPALALRLIAVRKSEADAADSRRKARRQGQKDGYQPSKQTLAAADWFILVTSLKPAAFSTETASGTPVQAVEELNRPARAARHRRAFRQTLYPGTFADAAVAWAVDWRAGGLSPLGLSRLTQPGIWRGLRQLVRSLLQAIMPQPSIAELQAKKPFLRRHLHEPPRKNASTSECPGIFSAYGAWPGEAVSGMVNVP
jgi:hypothetical protein